MVKCKPDDSERDALSGLLREVKVGPSRYMNQASPRSSHEEDLVHGRGGAEADDIDLMMNDELIHDDVVEQDAAWSPSPPALARYSAELQALVASYCKEADKLAWSHCHECLSSSLLSSSAGPTYDDDGDKQRERAAALGDMAGGLVRAIRAHQGTITTTLIEEPQGGTSPSPAAIRPPPRICLQLPREKEGVENALNDLRKISSGTGPRAVSEAPLQGEGVALILALVMEKECLKEIASIGLKENGDLSVREALIKQALQLLRARPTFLSVHCCDLAIYLLQQASSSSSSPSSSSWPLANVPPLALDCMIETLALTSPYFEYWQALEELGDGTSGLKSWRLEGVPITNREGARMIEPLGQADEGTIEAARSLWKKCQAMICVVSQAEGEGETDKDDRRPYRRSSARARENGHSTIPERKGAILVALLNQMRRKWAEARKEHRDKEEGQVLGRAVYSLMAGLRVGQVDGNVLGTALPLCFAMMEEYEREELQLLGYLTWLQMVNKTTVTELSWHLAIQMKVFERCLKVVRYAPVLRVLLYAITELLRLARPPRQEESEKYKSIMLEELLASLARVYDQSMRFALVEGLLRLVHLYAQGYLLVRYLRPLTQVLLTQLEEADNITRITALKLLSMVLTQCDVMAYQHAYETMAQIVRIYLATAPTAKLENEEEKGKNTRLLQQACKEVAQQLIHLCRNRKNVDLVGFLESLERSECRDLASLKL